MKRFLIVCFVVVLAVVMMAVPAFAAEVEFPYNGVVDEFPTYDGDHPYDGGGYVEYVNLDARDSGYAILYLIIWFEDPSSLTAFYDADNNLRVHYDGQMSYRYYAREDGTSFSYDWTLLAFDPGDGIKLFDVCRSSFRIYNDDGSLALPMYDPDAGVNEPDFPGDDSFVSYEAVGTFIATWIAAELNNATSLFYQADTGLTLLGVLSVCGLGFAVVFFLVKWIVSALKFRR